MSQIYDEPEETTQRLYAQTTEHDDTLETIDMFESYEMYEAMCMMERLRLEGVLE